MLSVQHIACCSSQKLKQRKLSPTHQKVSSISLGLGPCIREPAQCGAPQAAVEGQQQAHWLKSSPRSETQQLSQPTRTRLRAHVQHPEVTRHWRRLPPPL